MRVDHLAHPAGLAAQFGISGARANAGGDEGAAVELVGADGGQHDLRALRHLVEACGIARVGDDQRRFGARADQAANFGQLVEAAPRHRPFWRVLAALVMLREIFGDEPAGEAGRALDDDVEIAGRSDEHTTELQSLIRFSYAVYCLQKRIDKDKNIDTNDPIVYT